MRLDEIESNKYYHVSPMKNEDNILKYGLTPKIGTLSMLAGEAHPVVFLFTSHEEMDDALSGWMGDMFDEELPLTMFEVTVPDKSLIVDHGSGFEVEYHGTIPPENIKVIDRDYGYTAEMQKAAEREKKE